MDESLNSDAGAALAPAPTITTQDSLSSSASSSASSSSYVTVPPIGNKKNVSFSARAQTNGELPIPNQSPVRSGNKQSSPDRKLFSAAKPILNEIYNPDMQDSEGRTPLMRASMNGDIQRMQILLDKGARVFQVDFDGCYAVHFSATRETTMLLMQHGATLHMESKDGSLPAHMFCQRDDLENLELSVAEHVDIFTVDNIGNSLLHRACESKSLKCVRYLLQQGLSPNTKNLRGRTPVHAAAAIDNFDALKCDDS